MYFFCLTSANSFPNSDKQALFRHPNDIIRFTQLTLTIIQNKQLMETFHHHQESYLKQTSDRIIRNFIFPYCVRAQ